MWDLACWEVRRERRWRSWVELLTLHPSLDAIPQAGIVRWEAWVSPPSPALGPAIICADWTRGEGEDAWSTARFAKHHPAPRGEHPHLQPIL